MTPVSQVLKVVADPPQPAAMAYPYPEIPAPGTTLEVAPGVFWLRMPLPFVLDHINLWLLRDRDAAGECWTIVDTGYPSEDTRRNWEAILAGRRVARVIVTHYHPDHLGSARWLMERHGCSLWMTEGEYLISHAVLNDVAGYHIEGLYALLRRNGLEESHIDAMREFAGSYRRWMEPLPQAFHRIVDGDAIPIGGHDWRVIVGRGHSPEHASLHCESLGVMIAGDMVLPRITTNVSARAAEPDGDPLRLFLDSLGRYAHLPDDTLVLPSHGNLFRGLHARLLQLEDHHVDRLGALVEACREPRTAREVVPVLFKRVLEGRAWLFAMGESIAHLHCLMHAGRVTRSAGADGIYRFTACGEAPRARPTEHTP